MNKWVYVCKCADRPHVVVLYRMWVRQVICIHIPTYSFHSLNLLQPFTKPKKKIHYFHLRLFYIHESLSHIIILVDGFHVSWEGKLWRIEARKH